MQDVDCVIPHPVENTEWIANDAGLQLVPGRDIVAGLQFAFDLVSNGNKLILRRVGPSLDALQQILEYPRDTAFSTGRSFGSALTERQHVQPQPAADDPEQKYRLE